ncbi:uncharacterized protein LOC131152346 isoform X2 [Malania oleifera]|uniref:uncharacterized protein LOC131152346 isoform X2 n=1 Tax=Malania oleifera TaxID=397392 RepID=UPI0025ADB5A9|nr:uncharacterized protein LOC131152346 isoform X2 [Malania oleifera]
MQESLHFSISNAFPSLPKPHYPFPHLHFHPLSRPRILHFPISSSTKTSISLPPSIPKTAPEIIPSNHPPPSLSTSPNSEFQEKMLYLESIGIDIFRLVAEHPPIVSASLVDIKSTVDFMTSMDFTAVEFRRIVGMCPEVLNCKASDIVPVFTFLLREARVEGSNVRRVINRRPRLLICSVERRLRPTLYFLQSIGISECSNSFIGSFGDDMQNQCCIAVRHVPSLAGLTQNSWSCFLLV